MWNFYELCLIRLLEYLNNGYVKYYFDFFIYFIKSKKFCRF